MVAWCFAAQQRRPLDRLVIMNGPHPLCFRVTGIWPDRDIAVDYRDIEIPCTSLPTSAPQQPRSPAPKPGVLQLREPAPLRFAAGGLPARHQLLSSLACGEGGFPSPQPGRRATLARDRRKWQMQDQNTSRDGEE